MDEVEPGEPTPGAPPARAGDLLRARREAQGIALADVAQRTRIPQRHLEAIEAGDYVRLPAPTYAVGFARAYARAVGADEVAIGAAVRAEVDRLGRRVPEYEPYEMADPARVPSRGVAIAGLGLALAIVILVGLWYGTDLFRRSHQPETASAAPAVVAAVPAPQAKAAAAAPGGGQVVLTARDEVWLRVYDADNTTLKLGTLKAGESYTVPMDAKDPMINVGRADKLAVTLNGTPVAPLGTGERAIKDVRISGAALAARANAAASTAPPSPAPSASPTATHTADRHAEHKRSESGRPRLSETQRANLDSAATPPAAGNSTTP